MRSLVWLKCWQWSRAFRSWCCEWKQSSWMPSDAASMHSCRILYRLWDKNTYAHLSTLTWNAFLAVSCCELWHFHADVTCCLMTVGEFVVWQDCPRPPWSNSVNEGKLNRTALPTITLSDHWLGVVWVLITLQLCCVILCQSFHISASVSVTHGCSIILNNTVITRFSHLFLTDYVWPWTHFKIIPPPFSRRTLFSSFLDSLLESWRKGCCSVYVRCLDATTLASFRLHRLYDISLPVDYAYRNTRGNNWFK